MNDRAVYHVAPRRLRRSLQQEGFGPIFAAFLLVVFCVFQPAGADPDASIQPIIRVARANYDRIKTLDIVWTENIQPNNNILLWPTVKARLQKDVPAGHYRYEERDTFFDGRKDSDPRMEAFDGKVRSAYPWRDYRGSFDGGFPGYIERVLASGADVQPRADGAAGTCQAYAPVDFPFPPNFFNYLADCKVRTGPEISGGFTCVVADHFSLGKLDGRIWLDMDRGAMPVQEIVFHEEKPTTKPNAMDSVIDMDADIHLNLPAPGVESEFCATEVHEFKDGKWLSVWLPTKMKQSDTDGTCEEEVDVAHTRLNPEIDSRQFRVTFPAGAPVFNPATGYFFTTDPNDPSIDEKLPLSTAASQPLVPAKR